jgi:predicted cobalt transporter CbtA
MTNEEKLHHVFNRMKMAAFTRTVEAIVASILMSLIQPLTAEQLVLVADALHAAHQAGKAKAEEEILAEGAICSPKHGRMLEIEVPNA